MMHIGKSSDPIGLFFENAEPEKVAKIDDAFKKNRLGFVYDIMTKLECNPKTRRDILKGCIKYDCSVLLSIEELRKSFFQNYKEKKGAIFEAIEEGKTAVVEELVKADIDKIELDPKDQEAAIKMALISCQKLLLASPIDTKMLNHFFNVISIFLKKGDVSDKVRSSLIDLAVKVNAVDLLEQLMHMPSKEDSRGKAIIAAMETDNLDLAKALLKNGSISQEHQEQILNFAIMTYQLELAQEVLKKGPLLESYREIALENALNWSFLDKIVEKDYLDLAKEILHSGSISKKARDEALIIAARGGYLSFIEALLTKGEFISEEAMAKAVDEALSKDFLDVILVLLANGSSISDEGRNQAVIKAVSSYNLELLRLLLANGALISEQTRREALIFAFLYNDFEMLMLLGVSVEPALIQDGVGGFYINRHKIKELPALYLSRAINGFSRIIFLNPDGTAQPGIDSGGLTKQFIYELLDGLFVKKIIKLDERRLPLYDDTHSESYKNLGKLLSVIDEKNIGRTDRIYTGPLFDPNVFDCFKDFLDPTLDDKQRLKKIANHLTDATRQHLVDFLNIDEPSKADIATFRTTLKEKYGVDFDDETKEELLEICKEPFEPYIKAISLITSGFGDAFKAKILAEGVAYAEVMQGPPITKEALIAKLEVKEYGHLSEQQRLEVLKKREWIVEKITSELTADPESEWVKQFLIGITGQPVIPSDQIEIRGIEGVLCKVHTCFNLLDVPYKSLAPSLADKTAEELEALAKEKFLERLQLAITTQDNDLT